MCIVRKKWTFPAKPHLPHVMSIDFGAQTGDNAADSIVVMAGVQMLICLQLQIAKCAR